MAKLIFSLSPGETLDFSLNADVTRMGRNPGNDIVINNSWISSFHAEFRHEQGQLVLRDLHSSNGTTVNGAPITAHILADGDRIAFGQLDAVYDAEAKAQAAAVPVPAEVVPAKAVAAQPATRPVPQEKLVTSLPAPGRPAPFLAGTTPVSEPAKGTAVTAPVIIVGKSMAPPAATIAYDTARKEMSAELEDIQKKTKDAETAAGAARVAREAAQAELASVKAALAEAQKEFSQWKESEQPARQAREAREAEEKKAAEAARLAAAEAATALDRVKAETLASQQALESAQAERQSAQALLVSTRAETERASAALTGLRAELGEIRESLAGQESGLAARRKEAEALATQSTTDRQALVLVQEELADSRQSLVRVTQENKVAQEKILRETSAAAAELQQLQQSHATLSSEHTALREGAEMLLAEAVAWPSRQQAAEAELANLRAALHEARALVSAEEELHSSRLAAVAELDRQHQELTAKITNWQEQAAAAEQTAGRLAADQLAAATLQKAMTEALSRKETALAEAATLANRQAALLAETRVLEARLDSLRRETEGAAALNAKVTDLRQQQAEAERRLDILNDRLHGMSEAPDPNWGTVHSLARSFIKKLDLIDDLISHLTNRPEAAETLEQLSIFRSGLVDILKEYSIEAYSLEPGTVIDVAARKRIQIVETLSEGSHDGTRVVRTYRPGYVCLNGDLGIPTLLRKADVAVSIPMS